MTDVAITRFPEVLLSLAGVFFLFSYIYATNANMDYVQRFMSSHGNHLLAPDSVQERREAAARFLPLLAFDALWFVLVRLRRPSQERWTSRWALPLSIGSGVMCALAFPSFLRTDGLPVLGGSVSSL